MIFSRGEIERRWEAIRARLGEAECAVVPSFHNSYFVSGVPMIRYGRWAITVLPAEGEPVLVLPAFERSAAERLSPIRDIRSYRDDDGPTAGVSLAMVADLLRERGYTTVGVEAEGMPAAMYLRLQSALPSARLVDVTEAIDLTRMTMSAEEIDLMREASRIADVGMSAVLNRLEAGVTEAELAGEAIVAMQREGTAERVATNCVCYMQQDARSIEGHGRSMQLPIDSGTLLEVVCEAEVWHYMAGVERPIAVGDVTEEADTVQRTALRAYRAATDAVAPGNTFADVHRRALDVFDEAGYGRYVLMGSGLIRSILTNQGGRIEEANFRSYNDRPLAPGMVVSVEPWAAVPGVGGHRFCDMVLVTTDGHEILSRTPQELLRIDS